MPKQSQVFIHSWLWTQEGTRSRSGSRGKQNKRNAWKHCSFVGLMNQPNRLEWPSDCLESLTRKGIDWLIIFGLAGFAQCSKVSFDASFDASFPPKLSSTQPSNILSLLAEVISYIIYSLYFLIDDNILYLRSQQAVIKPIPWPKCTVTLFKFHTVKISMNIEK